MNTGRITKGILRIQPLLLGLALSSCFKNEGDDVKVAAEASRPRSMNDRFNSRGKEGYFQDSEGNWKINNNKRSSFETAGETSMAKREYHAGTYNAGSVQKKSWWGDTTHEKPSYQGNTDANRFLTRAADVGKSARESGSTSLFSGKSVEKKQLDHRSANEQSGKLLSKPSDAATDNRRDVFPEPEITDWRQQRAMDIKDTKSILGR
ncbi:MAG: hypothetical protein KGQ89_00575 [Verrucomicrobia bacterium]|nr:hypothetical protein [Verrucomicrobiota bacterium]